VISERSEECLYVALAEYRQRLVPAWGHVVVAKELLEVEV